MKRQELGDRRHNRIVLRRPAFIFTEPGAPWIECVVVDVSESGLCINVGALVVPEMFGVAFTSNGSIRRVCARAWRNGELIGARFLSAKDLRGNRPQRPRRSLPQSSNRPSIATMLTLMLITFAERVVTKTR